MYRSDHFRFFSFDNKSEIGNCTNRLTSVLRLRQTVLNRTDAWDSRQRPEEAVKCRNVVSGKGQFHL